LSIEIKDVSGCKRSLVVEVPAQQVDSEIDKLAQDYSRKAKVPGFRPGKVPLSIIKQRFGAELRTEAAQDLIDRHWREAVSTHDLRPLAEPVVDDLHNEPGNPLRFTLSFEVLPKLDIRDYTAVPVTVAAAEVEEKEVERTVESLRDQHAEYVPVEDREIRDGDVVSLKVHGEFAGGGAPVHEDDVTVVIGDPGTHEAFSANLRGARAGETRSFEAEYPEDYTSRRFAGKRIRYEVTVNDLKEKRLAELEDFAKDLGAEGIDELRARVRDDLVTNAKRTAEKNARESVLDEVVRRNPLEVPDCLVKEELAEHTRRVVANLARQGIDASKTSIDWRKVYEEERPHAERSVKRALILDEIAAREGIELTAEELEAELEKLALATNKSAAALRAQFEKDQRIQGFRDRLRRNKALDFIYRNANISGG
jgi:trigger factor